MAKTSTLVEDLRVLYETYSGQAVASAIGVTIRQIQNYLKENDPAEPSRAVEGRIREAFARHKAGLPIQPPKNEDRSEELMQSYRDQVSLLKEEVTNLRARLSLKQAELTEIGQINQSLLLTNQDILIQLLSLQKKQDSRKTGVEVGKVNAQNYQIVKKKGNPVDADR